MGTIVPVDSLTNLQTPSAVEKINQNFNKLSDAIDGVLQRDGILPAEGDLNMNGQRIYNLTVPKYAHEPVRLADLLLAGDGPVNLVDSIIALRDETLETATNFETFSTSVISQINNSAQQVQQNLSQSNANIGAANSTLAIANAAALKAQTVANTGVGRIFDTWTALAASTGADNDGAIVPDTDTGTHTDPITSTTVPNAGIYRYQTGTPSGWKRVSGTVVADASAVVAQSTAIAATLPALKAINFTSDPQPVDFSADKTGRLISYSLSDNSLPVTDAVRFVSAVYGVSPPVKTVPKALFVTSDPKPGVTPGLSSVVRIPFLIKAPDGTMLAFCQARATTDDYSFSTINLKTLAPGATTWSAERVILTTDASYHMDNISGVVDRTNGRIEFIVGVTPAGTTEGSSVDATTDPAKASRIYSFYTADNGQTFQNRQGVTLPPAAPASSLTYEDLARDPDIPYWNVAPGNKGIHNWVTDELMIAGNCAGKKGIVGPGSTIESWAGFIFYLDRASQKWRWRGKTPFGWGTNESNIIQRADGRIQMDARQHRFQLNSARVVHVSLDATGSSWSESYFERGIRPDQRVQGSVVRMAGGYKEPGISLVVYANCATNEVQNAGNRYGLTLFASPDDGSSFPWGGKMVHGDNPAILTTDVNGNPLATPSSVTHFSTAYSTMEQLDSETILLLYEGLAVWPDGTNQWSYRVIYERRINIRSLIA